MKTPILFIIFNRLETTKKVFDSIKKYQPSQLYIAADGPREEYEKEKCIEVRNWVLNNIVWDCKVNTLFQNKNLGCGMGPSSSITWFFEREEEGIILEDDCVPGQDFFSFCSELLSYYKNNKQISIISGCNFDTENLYNTNNSYFFSVFPYTWGWATWRRNWVDYEYALSGWKNINKKKYLQFIFKEKQFSQNWKKRFDYLSSNNIKDIWDYQFFFECFKKKQFSIVPNKNLISNIGFGDSATHTCSENNPKLNLKLEKLEFPVAHPVELKRNYEYDVFLQKLNYGAVEQLSMSKKIKRYIKKTIRKVLT